MVSTTQEALEPYLPVTSSFYQAHCVSDAEPIIDKSRMELSGDGPNPQRGNVQAFSCQGSALALCCSSFDFAALDLVVVPPAASLVLVIFEIQWLPRIDMANIRN